MQDRKLQLPYAEPQTKFILYSAGLDGITYHVRGLDHHLDAQDWPKSAASSSAADARVFDATNAGDCQEAIKRILAHGYFVMKANGY